MRPASFTRFAEPDCRCDARILLVDDTDEDASEILTVICDGDPRSNRGFDVMPKACFQHDDAYRNGGRA